MEIVALKNFVPDDVNKLIFKFVGFKPHPLATLFKELIHEYYSIFAPGVEFDASRFLWYRARCYRCDDRLDEDDMKATWQEEFMHFKLCSFCFEDCNFCPRCHEALTYEELQLTSERPLLCNQCDEEENGTNEEEDEEDEEEDEEDDEED